MTASEIPDDDRPAARTEPPADPAAAAPAGTDLDEADLDEADLDEADDDELDEDDELDDDEEPDAAPAPGRFRASALVAALAVGVVLGLLAGVLPGRLHHSGSASPAPKPAATGAAAPSAAPNPGSCTWYDRANSSVKVGRPASTGVPHSGPATLTVVTDAGTIVVAMDAGHTPCAIAALAHLASHGYYLHDACERAGSALQCGTRRPDFAWAHEDTAHYPRVLVTRSFQAALPCDGVLKSFCDKSKGAVTTITSVEEEIVAPRGAVFMTAPTNPVSAGADGVTYLPGGLGDGIDNGGFDICARETSMPADSTPLGLVTSGLDIVDAWAGGRSGQIVSVSVTYG